MLGLRRKIRPPHQDCVQVLLPLDLLGQRSKQVKEIQQLVGVPKTHWKSLYFDALLGFAAYVQQLPASESHHHPGWGGLLDHTLEVVIHALRIRRGHLLPQGADAEEITAKKDLWTYAIFSSALLHDVGKPLMDQVVELYDQDGGELGVWDALIGPMPERCWYRVRYRKDRHHKLHERAAPLLLRLIVPDTALAWLGSDRQLFSVWLAAVSGVHEDAGVIGEIVQEADRLSVASNLGATSTAKLTGARLPLHERLLTGLRFLFKENRIPMNRNGAAAWFDGDKLWLVSKRGVDALRDHLLQEGHDGIPTRNDRIFDELQQNNVLVANGDRSIWKVKISGDDWSHTLTCLCFSASKIWPNADSRPECFVGSVIPENPNIEGEMETSSQPKIVDKVEQENAINKQSDNMESNSSGGFDPVEFFTVSRTEEHDVNEIDVDQKPVSCATRDTEEEDDPGVLFRSWLNDGLSKDKFETNSVNARIHRVEEGLLLVSPGIFKDYDKEDWQRVQKRFQKLKLHRKTSQGTNIYTYQVTGKRNKSRIKGFLIEVPEAVFEGASLPNPNSHLELAQDL